MQSTEYNQAPLQLRIFLDSDYGSAEVIRLSGLSGTGVFRLRSGTASVIVKAEASPNEAWFYSAVAPLLRPAGVETPALMFQTTSASGRAWLVLEDIPAALPRERWLADGQLLHLLRILHGTLPPPISYRFRLIFAQRPPVEECLLCNTITLSFEQLTLFRNHLQKLFKRFEALVYDCLICQLP